MDEIRQIRYLIPPIFFVVSLLLGARLDYDQDNALLDLLKDISGTAVISPQNLPVPQLSPPSSSALQPSPTVSSVTPLNAADALKVLVALLAGTAVVIAGGVAIGSLSRLLLVVITFLAKIVFSIKDCIMSTAPANKLVVYWEVCQRSSYFDRIWSKCAPYNLPNQRNGLPEDQFCKYRYYAAVTFDHENLAKHAPDLHDWLARRWSGFLVSFNSAVALMLALFLGCWLLRIESRLWSWALASVIMIFLVSAGVAWWQTQRMHEFHSYRP